MVILREISVICLSAANIASLKKSIILITEVIASAINDAFSNEANAPCIDDPNDFQNPPLKIEDDFPVFSNSISLAWNVSTPF